MGLRKLSVLSIMAMLCLGWPAFSQVNGIEVGNGATAQVFGGKSPVVKVTDADGKELASIPIEKDPGRYIYSKSANTLYVVHEEKKSGHSISAVNLTTQRVDKQIPVGGGWEVDLLVSGDGRRLYCYTASKWGGQPDRRGTFYNESFLKTPYEPVVNVIDTASNELVATYNWIEDFRSDLHSTWFFTNELLGASDAGHLILRSEADSRWLKPIKDRLMVFSGQSSRPDASIDPGGRVVASMFSEDEKLLFVAVEGEKKTDGSLDVIDLEKGTMATHALTDHPTRLFRLGSKREPWILGDQEMRSLTETGELGDRRIQLNKPAKSEEGGETGASAFVDGFPGESISLAADNAAIQIDNKNGGSRHKVALIDLKKLQVNAIIPTMSAGEESKIRTSRILLAVALTAATGGNVIFTPNLSLRNESLAARPDGRFLFALDLEGHVITVVDVQTAAVVKRIPVNNSVIKLQVSADGKHLICFGKKTQQINLETNNLED
jgi:DNA-binding beta-propeller fold protein YncE